MGLDSQALPTGTAERDGEGAFASQPDIGIVQGMVGYYVSAVRL